MLGELTKLVLWRIVIEVGGKHELLEINAVTAILVKHSEEVIKEIEKTCPLDLKRALAT